MLVCADVFNNVNFINVHVRTACSVLAALHLWLFDLVCFIKFVSYFVFHITLNVSPAAGGQTVSCSFVTSELPPSVIR